jgi:outer membrane receptor protein involved in Fe transport
MSLPGVALAQAQPEAEADLVLADNDRDVIVVTGSRIARPDLDQSSPIAVVSGEEFDLQQTQNVEEVLNDLPQVIPATTGTSNNPGGGVATVNLRGLGTQRTLVLVDGRRYINFSTNQVVDLNTIPAALIERVDVVTGGRSAVYGSDAISGVVNFVTKRDFEGAEFGALGEISEEGDGLRWGVDGTIGANFSDGFGNVVLHASYFKRDPIFAGDRVATTDSFTDGRLVGAPGTLIPGGSSSVPSFRFSIPGLNDALGLAGTTTQFGADGEAVTFNSATDLYNFGPVNYLQVPQERFLVFAKANYEVNAAFNPYLQGQFINNRVSSQLAPTPISNGTPFRDGSFGGNLDIAVNSPFIGPNTQAALQGLDDDGDGFITLTSFGRRYLETGPRENNDDRNAYRVVIGTEGDIGAGWNYDAYYSYARTKNAQTQNGNIQLSALISGVRTGFQDPATGDVSVTPIDGLPGGGELVCLDASARANGCVPINIFGANQVSADAANYIAISAQNQFEATTEVASFAITNGDLFDIGGGPIGVALGAEWRREQAEFIPDTFLSSGDVGGFNAGQPTSGDYDVTEFFGEVNIPIYGGVPGIETLEVNGAARYSIYSNDVDGVFTWSAGALYEPILGLAFRGQYQKAIRGPSVAELFGGQTVNFSGANDPCATPEAASGALRDACIASGVPADVVGTTAYLSGSTSFPARQGGNPNLVEEEATTWTAGAVFVPSFLQNASLTVDYFNIQIDDAIGTVGAQNIVDACLRFGEQSFCDQISRTPQGEFESFVDLNFNAATLKTEGVDVAALIAFPLEFMEDANLSFTFNGTHLITFDYEPVLGLPILNECAGRFGRTCSSGTVAFGPTPSWRHTLRSTLDFGTMQLSLLWRHIGSAEDDDDSILYGLEELDAANYIDLTFGVDIDEKLSLNFGVDNLFEEGFQPGASTQQGGNVQQSNTFPTTYDVLGRYYSIGARISF